MRTVQLLLSHVILREAFLSPHIFSLAIVVYQQILSSIYRSITMVTSVF